MEYFANTATEWHCPLIAAVSLPINGGNRGTGKVEAPWKVVIEKGLD
jgi:hypothetical protein